MSNPPPYPQNIPYSLFTWKAIKGVYTNHICVLVMKTVGGESVTLASFKQNGWR